MARIAGFHPADPGSIPGDEVCLGMTLKAPLRSSTAKKQKNRYTVLTREMSFCAICSTHVSKRSKDSVLLNRFSLVRIQSCVIRGMAQRKRAWLITKRS